MATIRSLFGFLTIHGLIPRELTAQLIPPERDEHAARVLTEAEYQRLQPACANVPRDAALLEVILQTRDADF